MGVPLFVDVTTMIERMNARKGPGITLRMGMLAVLSLSLFATPAAEAQTPGDTVEVALQTVLTRALDVSPDLGEVRADRDFAEARSRLARSSRYLTEFNLTTAHAIAPGVENPNDLPEDQLYLDPSVRNDYGDWSPFTQAEVELIQPLYTWGELGGNIRAARYGVDFEEAAVDGKALEVALRAAELYYNVLLTNELARLAERAGDIVDQAKGEINRLLEEGAEDVDDADLFQVQITEHEFKRRVVEVNENQRTAQVALRRQMLLPDAAVVVPENDVLTPLPYAPEPLERYFTMATENRPEMAQARAGLAARDALVKVARSHYYPKLFFGFSTGFSYAPNRVRQPNPYVSDGFRKSTARTGFGFRQQLNFAQTRARVDQARAEREQVRHQIDGAHQLILFEVEKAYRDLIVAQAALAAQDSSLAISKEWLRVEYINFDLDLGDTENLIKAVQANLELEARYYEAVHRYNMAVLRLMDAVGTLVRRVETGTLIE